jgi:transposase
MRCNADQRKVVRQAQSAPLVADLEAYMREQCAKLSRGHDLAKAMNYMFKRWASFTRFLDDGRVCLSNNAAERALRHRIGQKVVVILWVRPRRAPSRRHV